MFSTPGAGFYALGSSPGAVLGPAGSGWGGPFFLSWVSQRACCNQFVLNKENE